jgi:lipopolysaccharide assembly protein B
MDSLFTWLPWAFVAAVGFFALGWLGAKFDVKRLLSESRELPQSYFKGINFLLNEQPDKALEALIEASKQHPEAVELQFALGSLFRRRGEVDRALRVHKDLSERNGLSDEQRATALYETALDYHKSGLLDHAEQILRDLIDKHRGSAALRLQVLKLLLNLYQQERDWRRAIDVARMLDADVPQAKRHYLTHIANFHCELAAEAMTAGKADEITQQLDRAIAENPAAVRANLMRGAFHASAGRHAEAIAAWRAIESQDPGYLGLAADQLLAAYEKQGAMQDGLTLLRELHEKYPALDLLNALFKATLAAEGPQAAYELVKDDLRTSPTLVGLDRLLEAQILAAPADKKADLETLKSLVHSHASRLAVYLCKSCGFKAKQFYWHCPACGGWDTFPPRRTAEYDTAERHLARFRVEEIETNY